MCYRDTPFPQRLQSKQLQEGGVLGDEGRVPAMLAFGLFREDDRKGVTVLRLTSIDKLTDLELYLSTCTSSGTAPGQPALASTNLITSLHSLPSSDELLNLIQSFDTCT